MGKRRELGHQLARDGLGSGQAVAERRPIGVDERLDRLETRVEAGRHEVLAFTDEETQLVALAPRRELAHELEARVRGRRDHATHSI
jgi:hypothetical protein